MYFPAQYVSGIALRKARREKSLTPWYEHEVKAIKSFDGWAICFPQEHFPDSMHSFLDDLELNEDILHEFTHPSPAHQKNVGRPSKRLAARKAYRRVLPAGHGDLPWKVVAAQLSEILGTSLAPRTIK
ncbi:hypothetical protein [Roseivivax sp. CAU 1761]